MPRFSLRTIAIFVPLVFSFAFAVWSFRLNSRRADTLRWYESALKSGRDLPLASLERDFGERSARKRLTKSSASNTEISFDGESRVVQIVRDAVSDADEAGDGILLYTLGAGSGTYGSHAPVGAKIDRVKLTADTLEVTLHGKLRMGSFGYNIDESNPQTYVLD